MDSTGTDSRNPRNESALHLGMASFPRRSELSHRLTTGTTTHNRHRPGSTLAQQLASSSLPVIKCDHYPRQVLRRVSTMQQHPGWVSFKCKKDGDGCKLWYWDEEYIDLLIARNLLDVRTLLARVETGDENRDDAMSNCMEAGKNEVCNLKKPIENCNSVCNEDIEKILIQLVGALMEIGFLLKCLIVVMVLFRLREN
ncbi:uncharacterized protein LOC119297084 [Triticum dicoccoides]|uniref:uncharacterized protein LOC119297084 n=1 Tax=Triticum dicoccoides TaxID=85692 RepID=UPI00188EE5FA|nr:uncharacterized protein LOC119297084 [Triticum dicoccoides]